MFSRVETMKRKGDANERFDYLQKLKHEFETTKSIEAKKQLLANLANFAYDPINYLFIKRLHIIDIFLTEISESTNEKIVEYAIGGICNLCSDPENGDYIIRFNGVQLITNLLMHRNDEIALNSMTTLILLVNEENKHLFTTPNIINKALEYKSHPNQRYRNLGTIFLEDFCSEEQTTAAKAVAQA